MKRLMAVLEDSEAVRALYYMFDKFEGSTILDAPRYPIDSIPRWTDVRGNPPWLVT